MNLNVVVTLMGAEAVVLTCASSVSDAETQPNHYIG
jgi:hypothetical protein